MVDRFVILGATGDLTARYLIPALVQLQECGQLPKQFHVLGLAQPEWDTERFRRHIAERLAKHAAQVSEQSRKDFLSRLHYRRADVTDANQIRHALGDVTDPIVVYLALPPAVFMPAIEAVAAVGPPAGSRVVVEKPFGSDLETARALNRLLHQSFPEDSVFRMDHFLGKQTVQNILGLRFANRLFEPIWNHEHIEWVEIIWDETLGLEGRASYYDRSGALRDMVQNHLLQLLSFIGMEPPLSMNHRDLRDRKVDVLRAVRRLTVDQVERLVVRGQYSAGRVGDNDLPSYRDEGGIDPRRETETFVQVQLMIDNWRWAGVPFVLRTGKALAQNCQLIVVHFRKVPHLAFECSPFWPNELRLQLNPDRLVVRVNINGANDPFELEQVELKIDLAPQTVPAYGRLLLDAVAGDPTLSIRDDEAEECWRIVEPILQAWTKGRGKLVTYPAGSDGPASALAVPQRWPDGMETSADCPPM
jgi:glucose-6-phosphate 1-dehydrogenase